MFFEWLTFLQEDITLAFYSMKFSDWAYPSYIVLWMVILYLPLHGIDREDPIAGMVYILYCVGSGATLFFALPNNFEEPEDLPIHFAVLLVMGLGAAYRWFHKNNQTLTREEYEESARKKKEMRDAS